MSVNNKMTAIADEIRVLSGMTGMMGLDAMAMNIADANSEVDAQENLIGQINTALDDLGGTPVEGNTSVDTCTVNLSALDDSFIRGYAYTAYENGKFVLYCYGNNNSSSGSRLEDVTLNNVVCDSMVTALFSGLNLLGVRVENIKLIGHVGDLSIGFYQAPSNVGTIATITSYDNQP